MKKILLSLFALILSAPTFAQKAPTPSTIVGYGSSYFPGMESFPTIRPIEHKKDLAANLKPNNLLADAEKISKIQFRLITQLDPEGKNLTWDLELPLRYVFLSRFAGMQPIADNSNTHFDDGNIWGRNYEYVEISFIRTDGKVLPPYRLFQNSITVNNSTYIDTLKEIETWVFSSVNNYRELNFVNQALNVDDYNRCKELGNLYHQTSPEQCILPDSTVFLNLNTEVKQDTIRTFDFDTCFENKNPLISGFPRRCIAPGGRIYSEQPKVKY